LRSRKPREGQMNKRIKIKGEEGMRSERQEQTRRILQIRIASNVLPSSGAGWVGLMR